METRTRVLAAGFALAMLAGCATTGDAPRAAIGKEAATYPAMPHPQAVPAVSPLSPPSPPLAEAAGAGATAKLETPRAATRKMRAAPARAAPAPVAAAVLYAESGTRVAAASASADFAADAALAARRDAYRDQLKQASYAFNPPTPIKVATPVTVYFWLDPAGEPLRLAEELKAQLLKLRPDEAPQAEAGRVEWSPRMRATLTGADFDITPTEGTKFDGIKNLSAERRSEWSWDVKARHVGERLPLHLQVSAVLPGALGEPEEVLKLDKLIHVEVTWWWLLDEFWEKYWKWLLGGLGTAIAGAIGAWWKRRQDKSGG